MAMPIPARRFTVDEVEAWPDDGNRYELVDGILLVTPAPVPPHQIVATRLASALSLLVRPWPDVHVSCPGAILMRPGLKMEPDVLVVRAPTIEVKWEDIHEHWLAVEVWSPSSVVYDRDIKRDAYLAVGVREVWLVDLEGKTVFVSRAGARPDVACTATLTWRPPMGGEDLAIDLSEIFRGLA
jgi:Uma2 family endonuclease